MRREELNKPLISLKFPVRLVVGHPPLQVGDLRSNRSPGTR